MLKKGGFFMKSFTNLDLSFNSESPVFKVNQDKDKVEEITYVDTLGRAQRKYSLKSFQSTDSFGALTERDILNAARILCRYNPVEFCKLYEFIQSDKIKGILKEALALVKEEYKIETKDTKEVFEIPEESYQMLDSYFFTAGFPCAVTDSITFKVGESGSIISLIGRSISPNSGKLITDFEFGQTSNKDALRTGAITAQRCSSLAKVLCQSSYTEYSGLINALDMESEHLRPVLEGYKSFASDINIVENTIKSR